MRANYKSSYLTKLYRGYVIRTRNNQKASQSMKFLRRKANQNKSIKILTKTNTNEMKQSIRKLPLHMILLSKRQDILTYSNVERIS